MRYPRLFVVSLLLVSGCGSAPPPKPQTAPTIAVDQKLSWILRLEDRRILRDPTPPPEPMPPPDPVFLITEGAVMLSKLLPAATSVNVMFPRRKDAKASPPVLVEGSQVGVVEKVKLPRPN